jgi:hypothetical protein
MIEFEVLNHFEEEGLQVVIVGRPAESGRDYPIDQIVKIDATMDEVKWGPPPEREMPLIARRANWNGCQFRIERAYLKVGDNAEAGWRLVLGEPAEIPPAEPDSLPLRRPGGEIVGNAIVSVDSSGNPSVRLEDLTKAILGFVQWHPVTPSLGVFNDKMVISVAVNSDGSLLVLIRKPGSGDVRVTIAT